MKAILNLKILIILLHTSTTQFLNYPPQGVQNYFPYQHEYYGMSNNNFGRRSYRRKPARIGRTVPLWSESDYSEYTDSSEKCTCSYRSCNECYKAKPCCKSMCQTCNTGMVVIPYPVPFLIVTTQSTTQAVNTTVTKTKTTTPIITTTSIITTTPIITTTTPEITESTEVTENTEFSEPSHEETRSTVLFVPKTENPINYQSRISTLTQSTIESINTYNSLIKKKRLRCPLISKGACVPKKHKKVIQSTKTKPRTNKMQKTGKLFPSDRFLTRPTLKYSQKNTASPSLRNREMVPKFQIVPIPDNIALKLLSQLRDFERYV